ncbi:MAG: hypothetical protein ACXU9D_21535, partial [Xanthobacteraceae bacterium]
VAMLTDAQKVDARRWMGYPTLNAGYPDTVYTIRGDRMQPLLTITQKLANLTDGEEAVLVEKFLTPLESLENAILTVSDNLDTNKAAVWERNTNEQADRERLFDSVRRRMCAFLGFKPGPELGGGNGLNLVRA